MATMSSLTLTFISLLLNGVKGQTTVPSGPTQPNIVKTCSIFHAVVAGDGCGSLEKKYGITHENFIKWNPDVSTDCSLNFWLDYAYCVGVGPTGPTQPNIAKNCLTWHTVADGDGCWSIEQKYQISHEQFIQWNPDVSSDCSLNFWTKYSYCVAVGGAISSTTSKSSTTTTTNKVSTSGGVLSSITSTFNATYSIREPIITWNLTSPSIETTFPPQRTKEGQPAYCFNWHLVQLGNTCKSIVGANSWLTMDEFLRWNPSLLADCSGLYIGWWVCVGAQAQTVTASFEYTTTAPVVSVPDPTPYSTTKIPSANSSFSPVPAQANIAQNCRSYYQAQPDDTCQVVLQYKVISEGQFFAWNPALEGNCQGMWVGYYYCVAAYEAGKLPMPPTETKRPSVTPKGQIGTCSRWYKMTDPETCDEVVEMFATFSKANFVTWNPSVGSGCTSLVEGMFYCVGIPGTPTTRTQLVSTTSTPTETPIQSGIVSGCSALWLVSGSDTCKSIALKNGISVLQLFQWNPSIGSACDNLVSDFYVCIAVGGGSTTSGEIITSSSSNTPTVTQSPILTSVGTSSTSSSRTTTTSAGGAIVTPSPHQENMVIGCRSFYKAQSGDGCWAIANSAGIDLSNFYLWNPDLGACEGLFLNFWYCIGIAGPVTSTSSGPPVPT